MFYLLAHWGFGLTGYPRSIFIIDALLLIVFLGGIHLARRIYRDMGHLDREKRVLIYGAGNAGEMIPGSGPGRASRVENILRVQSEWAPEPTFLARKVAELERLAAQRESRAVIERLREIVPTFQPSGVNGIKVDART